MGKRGPKRKPGNREPSGRLSRKAGDRKDLAAREEDENRSVAVEARVRRHGIKKTEALDQRAGSVIGRWQMYGIISKPQYEAALQYQSDAYRYSIMAGGPKPANAQDLNAVHGFDGADPDKRLQQDRHIRAQFDGALRVVVEATLTNDGDPAGALAAVVMRDEGDEKKHAGDLRVALNALARYYGITGMRKSA